MPTRGELLDALVGRSLLTETGRERIRERLGRDLRPVVPVVVGVVGAWIAVGSFVLAVERLLRAQQLKTDWAWGLAGLLLLVAAVLADRRGRGALALGSVPASAVAAQSLLAVAAHARWASLGAAALAAALTAGALYPALPRGASRFLTTCGALVALLLWVRTGLSPAAVEWGLGAFALLACAAAALALVPPSAPRALAPLGAGCAVAACAQSVLLSTTLADPARARYVTVAGLTAGLVLLARRGLARAGAPPSWRATALAWLAPAALGGLSLLMPPGVLLAIAFVLVGSATARRWLVALGFAVLPAFLVLAWGGVDMAAAGLAAIGCGLVILAVRWQADRGPSAAGRAA